MKAERWDLVIRPDGKCRAERNGVAITGWCKNAMTCVDSVRKRDSKK
jgi:hypothetical protein